MLMVPPLIISQICTTDSVASLKSSPGAHKAVMSKIQETLKNNKSLQMMKNKNKNQRMKIMAKMILNMENVCPWTLTKLENKLQINSATLATGMAKQKTQLGVENLILKDSRPTICAANVEVALLSETAVILLVTFWIDTMMAVRGTNLIQQGVETMILMSSLLQTFAALVAVVKPFKRSTTITMDKSPMSGVTAVQNTQRTSVGAVNMIATFSNQMKCAKTVEVESSHGLELDDLIDLERSL